MEKKKIKIHNKAVRFLNIGLLAPLLALVYTVFQQLSLSDYDAARQYSLLSVQMEHILMSLLLLVLGAGVFDMALKKSQR